MIMRLSDEEVRQAIKWWLKERYNIAVKENQVRQENYMDLDIVIEIKPEDE